MYTRIKEIREDKDILQQDIAKNTVKFGHAANYNHSFSTSSGKRFLCLFDFINSDIT